MKSLARSIAAAGCLVFASPVCAQEKAQNYSPSNFAMLSPEMQCAIDLPSAEISGRIAEEITAPLGGGIDEPSVLMPLIERILADCGRGYADDQQGLNAFSFAAMGWHMRQGAGVKLHELGFDPVRIDNVLVPILLAAPIEALEPGQTDQYFALEELRIKRREVGRELVSATDKDPMAVGAIYAAYLTGLVSQVYGERALQTF